MITRLQRTRAFPSAEGWGASTPGGTGGTNLVVTDLSDSGPGTLREALNAPFPRVITFAKGGVIQLASAIRVVSPYVTIDGSTAPVPGITITGVPGINASLLFIRTHNMVLRYIRLRNAVAGSPGQGQVCLRYASGSHDIIVDHCSLSWAQDEIVDAFISQNDVGLIFSITHQYCIISETLLPHSTSTLFSGTMDYSVTPPLERNRDVSHISFHHNLLAHNGHRNPQVATDITEVINNIVYNWHNRVGEIVGRTSCDMYNNYWKRGKSSDPINVYFLEVDNESEPYQAYPPPDMYIKGNLVEGSFMDPLTDNAPLFIIVGTGTPLVGLPIPSNWRRLSPLIQPPWPITVQPATDLMSTLLPDVGCSLPSRDATDTRILRDVINGSGIIPTTPPENIWGGTQPPPPTPSPRWNGAIIAGIALGIGWLLGLFRRS